MTCLANVKRELHAHGYCVARSVLSTADIATIEDRVRYIAEHADFYESSGITFNPAAGSARRERPDPLHWFEQIGNVPYFDAQVRRHLLTQPHFLQLASELVGEDIDVVNAGFFLKPPAGGAEVPWHQDAATWGVPAHAWTPQTAPALFDFWLALDPADASNGALELLPDSHLRGVVTHHRGGGLLPETDPQACGFDPERRVVIEAAPGDLIVYHQDLFHRSGRNDSNRPRLAAAGTLVSPADSARLRALLPHYPSLDRWPLIRRGVPIDVVDGLPQRASSWRRLTRKLLGTQRFVSL